MLGSLDALMSKMKLPDEKKADVSRSLAELDVTRLTIGELLRTDQQERLAKKPDVEPDWITRHLMDGSVCDGVRGFLEAK